jgi:hypothetical protein
MIAGEFYPAARLMDRLEVGSRALFGRWSPFLTEHPLFAADILL